MTTKKTNLKRTLADYWSQWRTFYSQENERATGSLGAFEWGVVLVAALGLMMMHFGGVVTSELSAKWISLQYLDPDQSQRVISQHSGGLGQLIFWIFQSIPSQYWLLCQLILWVGACVLGYLVIPIVYLKLCGRKISDYYLGWTGFREHLWVYLVLFIPTSLLVVWVSFWPDFQALYPFYSLSGRSWLDLIIWELAYGLQFFALEFFFRAFLLESLRKSIGVASVMLMLMPYCMIHFAKTPAESAGSLVAGFVLGMMALRGRSIWGGVLLHWLIAIEMDVMSLWQKGELPPF
jgi:membrane protease YdiL (CAAX protease family)